jgi:hypothetical protein
MNRTLPFLPLGALGTYVDSEAFQRLESQAVELRETTWSR